MPVIENEIIMDITNQSDINGMKIVGPDGKQALIPKFIDGVSLKELQGQSIKSMMIQVDPKTNKMIFITKNE